MLGLRELVGAEAERKKSFASEIFSVCSHVGSKTLMVINDVYTVMLFVIGCHLPTVGRN